MNTTIAQTRLIELMTTVQALSDGIAAITARRKEREGFLNNRQEPIEGDPEIATYESRLAERLEERRVLAHLGRQAELFLARFNFVDEEDPATEQSKTGGELQREVLMLRGELEALKATRQSVASAIVPIDEVDKRIRSQVERMVEYANERFGLGDPTAGLFFDGANRRNAAPADFEEVRRTPSTRYDVIALAAWLDPKALESRFKAIAREKRKAEGKPVLPSLERDAKLEQLDSQIDQLERVEMGKIRAAAMWGVQITPRIDTAIGPLLGCRVTTRRVLLAAAPEVAA